MLRLSLPPLSRSSLVLQHLRLRSCALGGLPFASHCCLPWLSPMQAKSGDSPLAIRPFFIPGCCVHCLVHRILSSSEQDLSSEADNPPPEYGCQKVGAMGRCPRARLHGRASAFAAYGLGSILGLLSSCSEAPAPASQRRRVSRSPSPHEKPVTPFLLAE